MRTAYHADSALLAEAQLQALTRELDKTHPMVGRLIGYLAVCEPREAEHRRAGRGAVGQPERDRRRGEHAGGNAGDRAPLPCRRGADGPGPHRHVLAPGDGLRRFGVPGAGRPGPGGPGLVGRRTADAPPARRAVLLEMAAFAEFLVDRLPTVEQEWRQHREALQVTSVCKAPCKSPRQPGRFRWPTGSARLRPATVRSRTSGSWTRTPAQCPSGQSSCRRCGR